MAIDQDIGQQISTLRKNRGWTQAQLSEISGLHLRTVQRAEMGRFRPESLMSLANALDVDVRDFHLLGFPPALPTANGAHTDQFPPRPTLFARVRSGKQLLDLLGRGVSWSLDHDPVTGGDAEVVAALFQAAQGYASLYPDLQPGERVRASAALHERLTALEKRNLAVMGAVEQRPLLIKPGHPIPRPVAVIFVQRPTTPDRVERRSRK